MTKKKWIIVTCCTIAAAVLCTAVYGEKSGKVSLPAAIEAAVKAVLPNAVIEKGQKEEEKIAIYEVKVKEGDKPSEVELTEDGTILKIESDEAMDKLPAAVANAIKAQNAKIKRTGKGIEYAQLKPVKLDTPATIYEAELIKDGKEYEYKIAADGTILKQELDTDAD